MSRLVDKLLPSFALLLALSTATPLLAQDAPPADDEIDKAEPDFTLLTLPTTLRLPAHKMAFRLTHRFTRPLSDGDFGDLVADFFGFDSSAQVGMELRFGLFSGTQLGIYRVSDRTIQFFLQQHLLRQGDSSPLGLAVQGSIEGLDNFSEDYSPRVAVTASRKLGQHAAVYLVPAWVGNTNLGTEQPHVDENTLLLGIGARVGFGGSGVYLVGEYSPRLAGYKGTGVDGTEAGSLISFALEKQLGGHSFQLNFSNAIGTTGAQVARGQDRSVDDWFIGFNLSRKFY